MVDGRVFCLFECILIFILLLLLFIKFSNLEFFFRFWFSKVLFFFIVFCNFNNCFLIIFVLELILDLFLECGINSLDLFLNCVFMDVELLLFWLFVVFDLLLLFDELDIVFCLLLLLGILGSLF